MQSSRIWHVWKPCLECFKRKADSDYPKIFIYGNIKKVNDSLDSFKPATTMLDDYWVEAIYRKPVNLVTDAGNYEIKVRMPTEKDIIENNKTYRKSLLKVSGTDLSDLVN